MNNMDCRIIRAIRSKFTEALVVKVVPLSPECRSSDEFVKDPQNKSSPKTYIINFIIKTKYLTNGTNTHIITEPR